MPTVGRGLFRWLFHSGARLEDFSDRLNHVWTFGLLLTLGAVISWKYEYGEPISCWCPAEFTSSMVDYSQKTCWHRNALYPRLEDIKIPTAYDVRIEAITLYHERIPLLLCLQALLFKLPNIILYILHGLSGLDFNKVAGLTAGFRYLNLSERKNLANQIARYLYRWSKMFPRGFPWRILTLVWFIVKCLYCVNIIVQFSYLDRFLKTTDVPYDNSTSFGDAIYNNLKPNATEWKMSPVFPHTLLCDFQIRQLRMVHQYTVQCVLHVNRFTERVYMFLWIWLLFVAVVTTLSFVVWIVSALLPFPRQRYIRRFLELSEEKAMVSNQDVSVLTNVMGEDGVMVMKLVGANSSELLVKDVICSVYKMAQGGAPSMSGQSGQIIQQPSTSQHVVAPSAPPDAPHGVYPELEKA